jgi:NAD(P) transhydrogenase subunit alpha
MTTKQSPERSGKPLPLPPCGGGSGWGVSATRGIAHHPHTRPPPPSPPPSGGEGESAAAWLKATAIGLLAAAVPAPAFAAGIGGTIDPVIYELMVFAMAIFVGYYVVWSVTPALHTPLMSVTNAISSVIVVGALLAVAVEHGGAEIYSSFDSNLASKAFGFLALAMAAVNIFGGFLVTQRMLAMYKKKGDKR